MKHAIWEQFDYYDQKQNKVLYINMEYMDNLPPTVPSLVSRARLTRPIALLLLAYVRHTSGNEQIGEQNTSYFKSNKHNNKDRVTENTVMATESVTVMVRITITTMMVVFSTYWGCKTSSVILVKLRENMKIVLLNKQILS